MDTITLEVFVIIRRTVPVVPVAPAALLLAACSSNGVTPTATDFAGVVGPAQNSSTPKTADEVTKTLGEKINT